METSNPNETVLMGGATNDHGLITRKVLSRMDARVTLVSLDP